MRRSEVQQQGRASGRQMIKKRNFSLMTLLPTRRRLSGKSRQRTNRTLARNSWNRRESQGP